MNPKLAQLHAYPFEKLAHLKSRVLPPDGKSPVLLSVGEPRHAPPQIALDALSNNLNGVSQYPGTRGSDTLREAIAEWLKNRFKLGTNGIDPRKHILPVNGTREALFAFAQCVLDSTSKNNNVLMPNPFYQIYEGATLLAGLQPQFYNTGADTNYLPDFDSILASEWARCQLVYICSPGNPGGQVITQKNLEALVERAYKYDFVIAADECYSEIYGDEKKPPVSLLQACKSMGNDNYERCVVFHSLSKRSNLPGLRSGFVAGDSNIIDAFFRYRTYHGCSMSPVVQAASAVAWADEQHVRENRKLYSDKFDAVTKILADSISVQRPDGGFYLWPQLPIDDESFTLKLFQNHNITVLPGRYLSRDVAGVNPGENHVRIALVAELEDCIAAAHCIRETLNSI